MTIGLFKDAQIRSKSQKMMYRVRCFFVGFAILCGESPTRSVQKSIKKGLDTMSSWTGGQGYSTLCHTSFHIRTQPQFPNSQQLRVFNSRFQLDHHRRMDRQTDGQSLFRESRVRGYKRGGIPDPMTTYRCAWVVLQEGRGSYVGGWGLQQGQPGVVMLMRAFDSYTFLIHEHS